MSDPLTDGARGNVHATLYEDYQRGLVEFLTHPTDEGRKQTIRLALEVDDAPTFHGGHSNLSRQLEEFLDLLTRKDKEAWAKLLYKMKDSRWFEELVLLSPFVGNVLLFVKQLRGEHIFGGPHLEDLIKPLLESQGLDSYRPREFMVIVSGLNFKFDGAQVFQVEEG